MIRAGYILVDQKEVLIESYEKIDAQNWHLKVHKNQKEKVKMGECLIAIEEIYEKTTVLS